MRVQVRDRGFPEDGVIKQWYRGGWGLTGGGEAASGGPLAQRG